MNPRYPIKREQLEYRIFTRFCNIAVPSRVDEAISDIRRAGQSNYTDVVIGDVKAMTKLRWGHGKPGEPWYEGYRRLLLEIVKWHMRPIIYLYPTGKGNNSPVLQHDPSLVAGYPAEARHVVRGGELVVDDPPKYAPPADKTFQISTYADTRTSFSATVKPRHHYLLSCKVSAVNAPDAKFFREAAVNLTPGSRYHELIWAKGGHHAVVLQANCQDIHVSYAFNSFDAGLVNCYLGLWGRPLTGGGEMTISDVKLETLGTSNIIRRERCPLTIMDMATGSVDDGTLFEPIREPLMESPRSFVPPIVASRGVKAIDSALEGRWYDLKWYHPIVVDGNHTDPSIVDPGVYEILELEFNDLADITKSILGWLPRGWFLRISEYRLGGHSYMAEKMGMTGGELMAMYLQRLSNMVSARVPDAEIHTYHDTFTPHNAGPEYYLFARDLAGSWDGPDGRHRLWVWGPEWRKWADFLARRGVRVIGAWHREFSGTSNDYLAQLNEWMEWTNTARCGVGMAHYTEAGEYDVIEAAGETFRETRPA